MWIRSINGVKLVVSIQNLHIVKHKLIFFFIFIAAQAYNPITGEEYPQDYGQVRF